MNIKEDKRIVLTLDAGGTSFRFLAVQGGQPITDIHKVLTAGKDLAELLENIAEGFRITIEKCPEPPVAISFAFPGPCDYPAGIIGALKNPPAFRVGGVALGPMLEEQFQLPVFINNDGDLFAYGEAIGGLLPEINQKLEAAGSPKRYRNLFGVTFGTGFGGGMVHDGKLYIGDNSVGNEIWCMTNTFHPDKITEEGVSIRAIKRVYGEESGIPFENCPDPMAIEHIAVGKAEGNREAAIEAYRRFGVTAGNSMAHALTLYDTLAVIGGGLSKAAPLYMDALLGELNSSLEMFSGRKCRRVASKVYDLEDESQLATFLKGEVEEIKVPMSERTLKYDPDQRVGIGLSRLGTSEAISMGAYAYALRQINNR